jgi:hypothetical protein
MAKGITPAQADLKKTQAADFMDRIGEPDRAQEFRQMSVDEYVEHRGITLTPNPQYGSYQMSQTAGPTKAELSDTLDELEQLLEDALDPELSREKLVGKIKEAADLISGEAEDDDSADDEGEDDGLGE